MNLRKRQDKNDDKYYFDGCLVCECGVKLTCTCGNSRGNRFYYYKCSSCRKQISQQHLIKLFINFEITVNPHVIDVYNKKIKRIKYEIRNINEDYETGFYTEREYLRLMDKKDKHLKKTMDTVKVLDNKIKQDELFTLNDYHIKLWIQKNIASIVVGIKDKSIISVETY